MRRVRLSCLHNVTQENVAEHRVELADCRAPHPEMSEDVAGGLSGKEATELLLPVRCWASVLHAQTLNRDGSILVPVSPLLPAPPTSYLPGRVAKKERRSSHLHLRPPLPPMLGTSIHGSEDGLDSGVMGWPTVSSFWCRVGNTASVAPGRKRDAVYQH